MTEHFYFRNHLCIAMELLSINLYELIKANGFVGFTTALIRRFTSQMLLSLSLMRHHRVVHCDLKPEASISCLDLSLLYILSFFSFLCRMCCYATQPRAQLKLLTLAVVVLNPIKVSRSYWSNGLTLNQHISLHLYSKPVLSFSRSHSWDGLQHGYRHVEPWLYFSRTIHGIPYLSWRA
jgi:serine/threonine protein kinase